MNNKNAVQVYDKIAEWFDENRSRELFEKSWLDKAIAHLDPGAKVLDLGCGTGEPIARYFADQGFKVTGVDASEKMLDIAKDRLPAVSFILSDMRSLSFGQKFDLLIAWHSFFHLSQDEQRNMFKVFADHLSDRGVLLFTSGHQEGEIWSDNGGENLYHASLSTEEYDRLLTEQGFKVLEHKMEDQSCGDATIWLCKMHGLL